MDLRLKLSPASRALAECDRYDPKNTEFTISLLDCRYLAGDRDLFRSLHDKVIPKLVMRESKALLQGLAEVTRERHAKYGMTLYHLEPNLKEAPGGLRDCNVANWLALISAMDKLHDWPEASSLRVPVRRQLDAAIDFLMSARCFLHFRHGRDDNTLSWEAQDAAATRKMALPTLKNSRPPTGCAILLRPCPFRSAHRHCSFSRNFPKLVCTLSASTELALAPDHSQIFPFVDGPHFSAATVCSARSRGPVCGSSTSWRIMD